MEKYKATLILHAIGDLISFQNGKWRTKYYITNSNYKQKLIHRNTDLLIELISDFIDKGGITNMEYDESSDKTLYHHAVMNALVNGKKDVVKLIGKMLKHYSKQVKYIYKKLHLEIDDEYRIMQRSENIKNTSGPAVRNLCIGLRYNGEANRDKLIEISILSSKLTHKSPISYLSGLASALFVAFAIEMIPMEKWMFKLITIVESDTVKNYINQNDDDMYDYYLFIKYLKKYIDTRFKNNSLLVLPIFYNLYSRMQYFSDNFTDGKEIVGDTGISAIIMAYDSLISCNGHWEQLIYYSILHIGNMNSIGAIACGLYGAVYGFKEISTDLINNISKIYKFDYFGEIIYNIK